MSLSDEDSVIRCALWPSLVRKGRVSEEHILGPALPYDSSKEVFGISVAARSLLPSIADAHDYGCRTASEARHHQEEKLQGTPDPLNEACRYLGYYEVGVSEVRSVPIQHFDINVVEVPEKNLEEHCHIELRVRDLALSNGKRVANTVTFLGLLWERVRGPEKHLCEHDAPYHPFLQGIQAQLPVMPVKT